MNYRDTNQPYGYTHSLLPDYTRFVSHIKPKAPNPLSLAGFYEFLKHHTNVLISSVSLAKDTIRQGFIQHFGKPIMQGGHMLIPVVYNDGKSGLLAVSLGQDGLILTNMHNKGKKTHLPFNDPKKSMDRLIHDIVFSGKTIKRDIQRLSGRSTVFGQRGRG